VPEARPNPKPGGIRILLVHPDPEPQVARTLAYAGDDVLAVDDDEHAARLLAVFKPDVVVVVARDSAKTCRDLRRRAPDIPIVAVVAGGCVDDRIAALEAGADDCLGTPFERSELIARIGAACRSRVPSATSSPPAGEHTLQGAA
jgi:DNA-binding response OmpR family regulator